jgi:hypothetical protein
VFSLVRQDGDGVLVARNLRAGAEHRRPQGKGAVITAVAPTKAEVECWIYKKGMVDR